MKRTASRGPVGLAIAGMMGVLACSVVKGGHNRSFRGSASTSRPQIVTESSGHGWAIEYQAAKEQPVPREISIWDTNSAPAVAPRVHTGDPAGASLRCLHHWIARCRADLLARLAKIDLTRGRISPEQAKEVNQWLQQLRNKDRPRSLQFGNFCNAGTM